MSTTGDPVDYVTSDRDRVVDRSQYPLLQCSVTATDVGGSTTESSSPLPLKLPLYNGQQWEKQGLESEATPFGSLPKNGRRTNCFGRRGQVYITPAGIAKHGRVPPGASVPDSLTSNCRDIIEYKDLKRIGNSDPHLKSQYENYRAWIENGNRRHPRRCLNLVISDKTSRVEPAWQRLIEGCRGKIYLLNDYGIWQRCDFLKQETFNDGCYIAATGEVTAFWPL